MLQLKRFWNFTCVHGTLKRLEEEGVAAVGVGVGVEQEWFPQAFQYRLADRHHSRQLGRHHR